ATWDTDRRKYAFKQHTAQKDRLCLDCTPNRRQSELQRRAKLPGLDLQQAVNVPGSIRANSVGVHGGKIVLNGGAGGIVNVGGTLTANGERAVAAGPLLSRARKSRSRATSPRTGKKAVTSQ